MKSFQIGIHWSVEDKCYIARSGSIYSDYCGISSHGDTEIEALKEFCIAMQGALEVAEEDRINDFH